MAEHLIELRDIYKIYPMGEETVHALDGISLTIDRGEFVAIIGASGSGKSTLLRCINLLETPTSGRIYFEGTDITDKSVDIKVPKDEALDAVKKVVADLFAAIDAKVPESI